MSNSRRLGIVLVAFVLAIGAFFVFRPDETTTRQDKSSRQREAERQGGSSGGQQGAGTSTTERAAPEPEAEEIRIADGRPVGGARTVTFSSGEEVRLAFRSDVPSEVHIHGYDRSVEVGPGRTTRVRFQADSEGSFEIEDHRSDELLARLVVEP